MTPNIFLSPTASVRASAIRLSRNSAKKELRPGCCGPRPSFPSPAVRLRQLAGQVKKMIVAELSNGQMVRDVQLAVQGAVPVDLYNWMGGRIPTTDEIALRLEKDIAAG